MHAREQIGLRPTDADRRLLDSIPAMVRLLAPDGSCTFANRAWHLFARAVADAPGDQCWSSLVHPDDLCTWMAWLRRSVAEARPSTEEFRMRRADGAFRWLSETGTPISERGCVVALVTVTTDVTDRRSTEAELCSKEARLQAILERQLDCVKVVAADGTVLSMNRAGLDMIEAAALEDVVGTPVERFVHPEDRPAFLAAMQRALQGMETTLSYRIIGLRGTERSLETQEVPVPWSGEQRAILSVTRDVTRTKWLEQRLRDAQKMDALGRLAGGIAHDFNNLLTVIIGCAELIEAGARDEHLFRQEIRDIKEAAVRGASLTRQLLAFSRRQALHTRAVELRDVLRALEPMLSRLVGPDLSLALHIDASAPPVAADANQIEQVIVNLILNARDAGATHVVLATRRAEPPEPMPGRSPAPAIGDWVTLTIADNGSGMTDEIRSQIFEPFFTTKAPGEGTGLGLATSYGIIRQFGGHITIDSRPGAGSTFTIHLPAAPLDRPTPA